jgi:hypothetical protein
MGVQCFLVKRVCEKPELWRRADGQNVPGLSTDEWRYPSRFGPGAIFRDYEGEEHADKFGKWRKRGDDGFCWSVILPSGALWELDGKSSKEGEGFWTRTGTAPNFTVTPSLHDLSWHGYLTNGILKEC